MRMVISFLVLVVAASGQAQSIKFEPHRMQPGAAGSEARITAAGDQALVGAVLSICIFQPDTHERAKKVRIVSWAFGPDTIWRSTGEIPDEPQFIAPAVHNPESGGIVRIPPGKEINYSQAVFNFGNDPRPRTGRGFRKADGSPIIKLLLACDADTPPGLYPVTLQYLGFSVLYGYGRPVWIPGTIEIVGPP